MSEIVKPEPFVFSIPPHTYMLFRKLQERLDASTVSDAFVAALLIVGDMIDRWKLQEQPIDFLRWYAAIVARVERAAAAQCKLSGHETAIMCSLDLAPADHVTLAAVWRFFDIPLAVLPRRVIECAYYRVRQVQHRLPDDFPKPFP